MTAIVAALAAVGIAGCGDSAGISEPALTKGQFVEQANALCNGGRQEALATTATKDPIRQGVVPAIQGVVDGLRALTPPANFESEAEALVAALQRDIDQATRVEIADLPELEDEFAASAKKARAHGIDGCAFAEGPIADFLANTPPFRYRARAVPLGIGREINATGEGDP